MVVVTHLKMKMYDKRTTPEDWGLVLFMLDEKDPRPAREQLDAGYQHGGGWRPQEGFTFNKNTGAMTYPGDPPLMPLSSITIHGLAVVLYPYGYVALIEKDGSFEISRID